MSNPFANWSIADAELHNSRVSGKRVDVALVGQAPKHERDLHSQIFDECRRRGWIAFHGSMAERTHRTEGECDFHCLLPGGKVVFVECKTLKGKLSPAQMAMKAWMKKLGHEMHIVRSFAEFLQLISGAEKEKICVEKDLAASLSYAASNQETDTVGGSVSVIVEERIKLPGSGSGRDCNHVEGQGASPEQFTGFPKKAGPTTGGKV